MNTKNNVRSNVRLIGVIIAGALLALLSACNRQTDNADATAAKAPTVGMQIDDAIVTSKVKSALLTDPDITSADITVATSKGEVLLSGFVDNQDQVNRSVAVARSIEGVKSVNNLIALKNGPSTIGDKIDDGVVTAKVKSALISAEDLKSMEIAVATNKGVVQLSGFVDSDVQVAHAADVAKRIEGVASVANQLTVKK